jgi:serralysin
MKRIGSVFAVLAFGLVSAGCAAVDGDGPEPMSWDEFQAQATQEPVTGTYVYDGDQTALNLAELNEAYEQYLGQFDDGSGVGIATQPLIVNVYNGKIDKWADATALTYCVSKKSFGARYNDVVQYMATALGNWEATGARVHFTHLVAQDGNCTNRNNNVTFNVRQDRSTQYYAKAFFPYYPRSAREVVISTISYGNLGVWTLGGILTHELGHSLGFRHEHIRPENTNLVAPCSREDSNWAVLTAYDSASVMHYPHNGCAGTNKGDLAITSLDAQGARALYP